MTYLASHCFWLQPPQFLRFQMNLCGAKLCLSLVGLQVVDSPKTKQTVLGMGGFIYLPHPFCAKTNLWDSGLGWPYSCTHARLFFQESEIQSFTREQFIPNIPQKNMSMFSCQFLPTPLSQVAVIHLWSFQISQKDNDRGVGLMTRSLQKSPTERALAQHHPAVSAEAGSTLSSLSDIWDPFHERNSECCQDSADISHYRVPRSRVFALCSGTFHYYC